MKNKTWSVSDISNAIGAGTIELENNESFYVIWTAERLVFGGACNVGFLESGYLEREQGESVDEGLAELLADLEVFYRDGAQFVSRIICNERM